MFAFALRWHSSNRPPLHPMRLPIFGLLLMAVLAQPASAQETKVLFLGNSYTNVNNLPVLFANLAQAAGHVVMTDKNTPGGNTLGAPQSSGSPHRSNAVSLAKIAANDWDVVVLQEQSYLPTIPYTRDQFMRPGAQSLANSIAANDPTIRVMLFSTWGRRDGGSFCYGANCESYADFDAMQDALSAAYGDVAASIGAEVAMVGEAWRRARALDPALVLHSADGSHPSLSGSYLAACVFYACIFDDSPVGLAFDAGLDPALATFLQEVANSIGRCGVERYCLAAPNSASAAGALIDSSGSASVAANDLVLEASQSPPGQFGLFLVAGERGIARVGDGFLCLGGAFKRLNGVQIDAAGGASLPIDLTQFPFGAGTVVSGVTQNFQFVYRDPLGPQRSGWNLSDALAVTFCP